MPEEIIPYLPNVMVIQVEQRPLRFRFRIVGTYLVSIYGQEYTGKYLDELDLDEHRRVITCDYLEASQCGIAHCDEYAHVMHADRYRHFERLLLPLAADGRNVDMLFGSVHEYTFTPRGDGFALRK